MGNRLLHTPEGVRDIYNGECREKLVLQSNLSGIFAGYGYNAIQTPTFEFFDIFSRDIGTTPSRDLYKFIDKDGETLVLRPDMTPSVARCAAKYFMEETNPLRFCYLGNTFKNNHGNYRGQLNETTEIGAELIGDPSVEADAEMVAMIVDALKCSGLKEFQVSIGEVNFFKSLLDEAGISPDDEEELRELISRKNLFGVEEFLEEKHLSPELKSLLTELPNMFGNAEVLAKARSMTKNEGALNAISRLEDLLETLNVYGCEQYVSFDLGMLSKYKYYTGIIIKAYTYGLGDHVVSGGRYDRLLSSFGKDAAAIGFVINVDSLMSALSRQKIDIEVENKNVIISYSKNSYKKAVEAAVKLRSCGLNAGLYADLKDALSFGATIGAAGVLAVKDSGMTYTGITSGKCLEVTAHDLNDKLTGRA